MALLTLAHDLKLPADEAVAQKYAFIGRSGSGKTYGAMKLAELFLTAEAQVIVLDWVGNWWALRLAKDGKAPGFPHVYIFGGEHQDAPLEATSGAMMADLLVDKHISAVLDLSPFRKGERTRFATAFAEQLFHRKKTARTACHLFLEEAQAFLPQMVRGDDARMVGVFEDIGKVGRNYGIGVSILSQRPQAVNKDVLNQTEVLLAFQTNGPQERKTIGGWVVEHGESDAALVDQLPTLSRGDAFVWSPQWLQLCRRVHIAERVTYDASSTPTQRAKLVKPKALTPADLQELGEAIKATVETAKANDPRELKRRVTELEKQLAAKAVIAPAKETRVEIPVLKDSQLARLEKIYERMLSEAERHGQAMALLWEQQSDEAKALLDVLRVVTNVPNPPPATVHHMPKPQPSTPSLARSRSVGAEASSNGNLARGERKILTALAQYANSPMAKTWLAILTGYAHNGGGFNNYLSALRTRGYLLGSGDRLEISSEGLSALGSYDPLPTGSALLEHWFGQLGKAERMILDALAGVYPKALSKEQLGEKTGYESSGGGFNNALSRLRTLELIEGRGELKASDALFD